MSETTTPAVTVTTFEPTTWVSKDMEGVSAVRTGHVIITGGQITGAREYVDVLQWTYPGHQRMQVQSYFAPGEDDRSRTIEAMSFQGVEGRTVHLTIGSLETTMTPDEVRALQAQLAQVLQGLEG